MIFLNTKRFPILIISCRKPTFLAPSRYRLGEKKKLKLPHFVEGRQSRVRDASSTFRDHVVDHGCDLLSGLSSVVLLFALCLFSILSSAHCFKLYGFPACMGSCSKLGTSSDLSWVSPLLCAVTSLCVPTSPCSMSSLIDGSVGYTLHVATRASGE